jgi:hypothetical protein
MMTPRNAGRPVRSLLRYFPIVAILAVTACDDPFGPQLWNAEPVAVTLYSASRAEYVGMVSALDLAADPVAAVAIEAPGASGNWDMVLIDTDGGLSFAPAGALPGFTSRARIAVIENQSFIQVTEAPRDTAAYTINPVRLRTDVVYVIRSRSANCGFSAGVRYAKVQPIEVDVVRGIFRFAVVRNPYCEDRSLVPPPA